MDTQPPSVGGIPANPGSDIVTGVQQHGDAVVVDCAGDIDALTAPQLTAAVTAALEKRPRIVMIDLRKVDFLSSAGLAALVESSRDRNGRSPLPPGPSRPARRPPS